MIGNMKLLLTTLTAQPAAMALVLASIALAVVNSSAFAQSTIPDSLKPISAATRIFALQNHLFDQIGIASATEGHIGEHIEVNPAPDANCTFVMKKRDGPWVESINFKRLSSEYGVSRDRGYYSISLHGSGEAACYNDVQGKACEDHLSMLLTEDEMTLALRALRYIFSNVCAATELPF
jgi:hypothetical protein